MDNLYLALIISVVLTVYKVIKDSYMLEFGFLKTLETFVVSMAVSYGVLFTLNVVAEDEILTGSPPF